MGRPTDLKGYVNNTFGDDKESDIELPINFENNDALKGNRFIFLKNVTVRQGNTENYFAVSIVDALEVSAWGFFNPKTATHGVK